MLLLLVTALPPSLASGSQSGTLQSTYVRENSNLIYIGNGFIELQLQKSDGGIYSVINKMTGEDYRTDKQVMPELFWFGNSSTGHDSSIPDSFHYSYVNQDNGSTLTLAYVFTGAEPSTVTATVRVVPNSSLSYWRISISNPGRALIDLIDFPEVTGIGQVGNQTSYNYLLMCDEAGSMINNLYSSFITNSSSPSGVGCLYPQSEYPIQLMVLGNPWGGLYVSSDDTSGNTKQFTVSKPSSNPSPGTITASVLHYLPEETNSSISTAYDTVLGVFKGDWHEAADIYRTWATRQWWTAQGPLSQIGDLPDWFKGGFVVLSLDSYDTYDQSGLGPGSYEYASFSQLPVRLSQYLAVDNSPVLVWWQGWEKYGQWIAPDVFPPMEGWAAFNETVAEVHAMEQHIMVGLSSGTIYTDYPGFNDTQLACASEDQNGAEIPAFYTAVRADPACPQFRSWLIGTVTALAKSGVDGVELDGVFFTPYDYRNTSAHPPGYGEWWASAWISLLQQMRASVDRINPDFVFASEGLPETFIPWVHAYIDDSGDPGDNWFAANFGGSVSMVGSFNYVYDGYAVPWDRENFGGSFIRSLRYVSPSAYETYRNFAQALGVANGAVPDFAGNPFIWDPPDSDLSRGMVWASSSFFRDFSPYGERISPPAISVPVIRVTTSYDTGLDNNRFSTYLSPSILSVAALSRDGRLGYLFINVDDVPHSFTFSANVSQLAQTANLEVVSLNGNSATVSSFDRSKPALTINLPPLETLTVEIVPSSSVTHVLSEYDAFKSAYISNSPSIISTTSTSITGTPTVSTSRTLSTALTSTAPAATTSVVSTTNASVATGLGDGGIPEFPLQIVAATASILLVVVSYLALGTTRRTRTD